MNGIRSMPNPPGSRLNLTDYSHDHRIELAATASLSALLGWEPAAAPFTPQWPSWPGIVQRALAARFTRFSQCVHVRCWRGSTGLPQCVGVAAL
jgi:hypothetical protein